VLHGYLPFRGPQELRVSFCLAAQRYNEKTHLKIINCTSETAATDIAGLGLRPEEPQREQAAGQTFWGFAPFDQRVVVRATDDRV
jgi:hypothetical protein